MPDEPSAKAILNEARGAHVTSREILGLMQETEGDPIRMIIATLEAIQLQQQTILTKLEIIERRLASRN
jgi:ribosomal 50S subunit-associated protein YjgA (DUF615 family)